jgi:hypothetical protein
MGAPTWGSLGASLRPRGAPEPLALPHRQLTLAADAAWLIKRSYRSYFRRVADRSEAERHRLLALAHSDRAGFSEALKASGVTKMGVRLKVELLLKEDAGPYHGFDRVRMDAKALISTTEPACAHAMDLVLLRHLLSARLGRDGVCEPKAGFARVWRDHVVPIAASRNKQWKIGMCAGARSSHDHGCAVFGSGREAA